MGVPRFFRHLSVRYPCILKLINEYQIPEFDNLYLDMNGIIHPCSHPNNSDAQFRISEEDILKNIFQYIEMLFNMIKPQKLLFLSVDGVAPRAKINQQRARRFRTAKEDAETDERARARGEVLPEEKKFDSNCITPGTAFMARLTEQLKYFITWKVSTNTLWQKCKIIFSGPEVPGEGEHKIMDYIRYTKSQPDYDPCTRHCLYGLDADLIVLGMSTHELYFSVLREEVLYGRNKKRKRDDKINFCLLQTSVLRNYIELEFASLKDKLSFPFDVEKIIDDWILMGFLIGNDFIPHLPNLVIETGALTLLYEAYKEVMPTLDGYINEAGTLRLERFEKFMEKLSQIDIDRFADHYADLKYFEQKTGRRPNENERTSYRKTSDSTESNESPKKIANKELNALIQLTDAMLLGHSDEEEPLESDSSSEIYNIEFLQHKRDYYMNKFEYESIDAEVMRSQAEAYVTALQWNLNYYYNGCCSWSWHYPHHYAPYISDIKDFKDFKIEFTLGEPFLPFQQLLSVLPAASKDLVPEVYHSLMTSEDSPIIDYYPADFETDINGRLQSWEAVILIPIIDEKRLLDAMEPYNDKLTEEERQRNKHGAMKIITYTEENLGTYKAPEYFPSIESHAKVIEVWPDEISVPKEKLVKGLCKGVNLNAYCPGFPSFKFIEHSAKIERLKEAIYLVNEYLLVTITPKEYPNIEEVAEKMLGQKVFVEWPYLREALVIGVSTIKRKISLINADAEYDPKNVRTENLNANHAKMWQSNCSIICETYRDRQGIDVGPTKLLLYARPLIGKQFELISSSKMLLKEIWSTSVTGYAFQSVIKDIPLIKSRKPTYCSISEVYSAKSVVFMLGHPHYGAMGEIIESGINQKTGRIKVAMKIVPEPDFTEIKRQFDEFESQRWMSHIVAAQRLGISNHLINRITGSIFVARDASESSGNTSGNCNIGLNLKFTKRNEEMPGYTKKSFCHWLYSMKTITLIKSYMQEFPLLFKELAKRVGEEHYLESDLFKDGTETLDQVLSWLKIQPNATMETQSCDFNGLDSETIDKMEEKLDEIEESNRETGKTVLMQVKPHLLYKPGLQIGNMLPDSKAHHRIFDRIINVKENSVVPLGLKGTIVGIHASELREKTIYVVAFDKKIVGINCGMKKKKNQNHRHQMLEAEFINVSHGVRAELDINSVVPGLGISQPGTIPAPAAPPKSWRREPPISQVSAPAQPPKSWRQEAKNQNQTNFEAFASLYSARSIPLPSFSQNSKGNESENQQQRINIAKRENIQQNRQQISNFNVQKVGKSSGNSLRTKDSMVEGKMTKETGETKKIRNQGQFLQQDRSSEFQTLWNELHKPQDHRNEGASGLFTQKPMRPPGMSLPKQIHTSGDSLQDESAFLKAMLKISDKTNNSTQQTNSKALDNKFVANSAVNNASSAPPLVQQMFDHARQARTKENLSSCTKLLTHFQISGFGLPRYNYLVNQQKMVCAQIILPDMRTFCGEFSVNHAEATESAAKVVCKELKLDGSGAQPGVNIPGAPPAMWLNSRHSQGQVPGQSHNPGGLVGTQMMLPPVPAPSMMREPPHQTSQILPNIHDKSRPVSHSIDITNERFRNESKPLGKNKKATSFVPLQAQKKTRNPKSKQTPRNQNQTNKEQNLPQGHSTKSNNDPPKAANNEKLQHQQQTPSPISGSEKKEGDAKKSPQNPQKTQKAPRQRRSRVAANFNSSSPGNGSGGPAQQQQQQQQQQQPPQTSQ